MGLAVFNRTLRAEEPAPPNAAPSAAETPTAKPTKAALADPQEAKRLEAIPHSRLTRDEAEDAADRRELALVVGETYSVDLEFEVTGGVGGITVGRPDLLTFQLVKMGDRRQITFNPLKVGETTVSIRDETGELRLVFLVRVQGVSLPRVATELMNLLRDIEGLNVRIVGSKVVLEGEILVPNDYGKLLLVAGDKAYADYIINLAEMSPLTMQVMARRIQEDIASFAPNVRVRVVNGLIILEGNVDNPEQARQALDKAYLYLPDIKPAAALERDLAAHPFPGGRKPVFSYIVINPQPQKKQDKLVRITAHFVELSKDYTSLFGFKWAPGFSSDPQIQVGQTSSGTVAGNAPTLSGAIGNLLPQLQSAQQAGYARVVKTGTVVVRSGQPAQVTEQTQYTYTMAGAQGQVSAGSSKVGLSLAVTPQIVGKSDDIDLELELDQTDLVGKAPASNAPPVTTTHKIKTKLYVRSNESAAVGGVLATDLGTDFNKDAPLGASSSTSSYSPLFSLLRSKSYTKTKTQFVIFITPQIVENASEGTDELKKNFRIKAK